jgi:hypothetical protein
MATLGGSGFLTLRVKGDRRNWFCQLFRDFSTPGPQGCVFEGNSRARKCRCFNAPFTIW